MDPKAFLKKVIRVFLIVFYFYAAMCILQAVIYFALPSFAPTYSQYSYYSIPYSACYTRDALLPYVECAGFTGYQTVAFVLNIPGFFLIGLPFLIGARILRI